MIRFLLDEHVPPAYARGLQKEIPDLVVWAVGDSGAPPKRTPDPDLLIWCDARDFVLLTSNRASMPVHLTEHLRAGGHVPGIITLNPDQGIGDAIQDLVLLAQAAAPEDLRDGITYLPL